MFARIHLHPYILSLGLRSIKTFWDPLAEQVIWLGYGLIVTSQRFVLET